VFVDFNQNAKDRTVASAYSIRPLPDARVSTPLAWDEVRSARPELFTVRTVPGRFADGGDPHAGIDDAAGTLDKLIALAAELGPADKAPRGVDGSGRRQSVMPLIEVARTRTKPEALAALEEWKTRHADIVPALHPADVLVDGMRGSSSLWYRVRVNLQHVPEGERPPQEELIANYDPWAGREWPGRPAS
jgi:bifunctional non-homologous end joining protein LigD